MEMKVLFRQHDGELKSVDASILSVIYRDKTGAMCLDLAFDPDTPNGDDAKNLRVMAETILDTLASLSENA